MQFALDENNIRIKPLFSGQKAECPLCDGLVIAKCGEIYSWHWQHSYDRECDPWNEHETEWHRKWKAYFPLNCQEVIIENYDQKHIADVRTSRGVVIEFQNSSIAGSTIHIREAFYENMSWVINAQTFKDNFQLRSVVSTQLRRIESNASHELSLVGIDHENEIKRLESKIASYTKMTADKARDIQSKKQSLDFLRQLLTRFDVYADEVIDR